MGDHPLVVSEVFGPTFQGEGPSVGQRAGFVRLGRCNLDCTWCDTPYSWDWERYDPAVELSRRPVAGVVADLEAMGIELVVVTGGEPLLQQRALTTLLEQVKQRGWRVEVETNGTVAPALPVDLVDRYNVSPKLANSGVDRRDRYRPDVLRAFEGTGKAVFKFVAADPADLDEVDAMVHECGLRSVYVMPEGRDHEAVTAGLRRLAEPVLRRGWNLTTRLHVQVWGDRRGV